MGTIYIIYFNSESSEVFSHVVFMDNIILLHPIAHKVSKTISITF
jgi:hypothetical protein